jgi:hypothetical protein
MQIVRKFVTLVLALLMAVPAAGYAEGRQLVDPATLAATLAQHVDQQDADRAVVREALARPEVREMAGRLGLDMSRAADAVDTLAGADLDRAASAARQVNKQLVGGASTIVISTTTVIIALLVVILLVVALK